MANIFIHSAACVCLGGFVALLPREPDEIDRMATGSIHSAASGVDGFELHSAVGNSCRLGRSDAGAGGLRAAKLGPGCTALYAGLEGVRYWRDEADGSVSLAGADDKPVVMFAVADGAGYESYWPKLPLLSLTPVR